MSTAERTRHPIWGDNLANQYACDPTVSIYGEDGKGYKTVTVPRFWSFLAGPPTKQKKVFVGHIDVPATDEHSVKRYFWHRCGLATITVSRTRRGTRFNMTYDGHADSLFDATEVQFVVDPKETVNNSGKPVATVWFSGEGPRNGPLRFYGTSKVVCSFASTEQMNAYLDFSALESVSAVRYQGVEYTRTEDGVYQSSDGSGAVLLGLAFLFLLFSLQEREAFIGNNVELADALPVPESSNDMTSSVQDTVAAADGITIEMASQPDGLVFDQNTDTDFGHTDTNFGGSFGDMGGGGVDL